MTSSQQCSKVGVHKTAKNRHRSGSRFSHFEGGWDALCKLVREAFANGRVRPGNKAGTFLAEVSPPDGFFSSIGAERTRDGMFKQPGGRVDVVVWNREALDAEGDKTEGDVVIVSLRALPAVAPLGTSPGPKSGHPTGTPAIDPAVVVPARQHNDAHRPANAE